MVQFKEDCPPYRIDCPLGKKPGESACAEEKLIYADCAEKGWICHVIPIEVGCHSFLGHSFCFFQK